MIELETEFMSFSDALKELKKGNMVRHDSWSKSVYLYYENNTIMHCCGVPAVIGTLLKESKLWRKL